MTYCIFNCLKPSNTTFQNRSWHTVCSTIFTRDGKDCLFWLGTHLHQDSIRLSCRGNTSFLFFIQMFVKINLFAKSEREKSCRTSHEIRIWGLKLSFHLMPRRHAHLDDVCSSAESSPLHLVNVIFAWLLFMSVVHWAWRIHGRKNGDPHVTM